METVERLDCGHAESPHADFTRGYGTDRDGKRHCYDCCAARDLASIARAEPFTGYLTMDAGRQAIISNWAGSPLLRVTKYWKIENSWVKRGCVSNELLQIRAVDAHGRAWYGRGLGQGMYCKMRPTKAAKEAAARE